MGNKLKLKLKSYINFYSLTRSLFRTAYTYKHLFDVISFTSQIENQRKEFSRKETEIQYVLSF